MLASCASARRRLAAPLWARVADAPLRALMAPSRRGGVSGGAFGAAGGALAVRANSSFIKRVMDQVNSELAKNEGLKKAREEFEKSGGVEARERLRTEALAQEEKLRKVREAMGHKAEATRTFFARIKEQAIEEKARMKEKLAQKKEAEAPGDSDAPPSPRAEWLRACGEKVRQGAGVASGTLFRAVDATKGALSFFDARDRPTRHEQWKAEAERRRAAQAAEQAAAEAGAQADGTEAEGAQDKARAAGEPNAEGNAAKSAETALVVSHATAWDRFGANLRDMPFLSSFYENPLFERMFSETEIAQSLREMKQIDPAFLLAEFAEEIEHVIAPHVVKSFLECDRETLRRQCGGAAFAAVDSSMKEREKQRYVLDADILLGPTEIELKGAKTAEYGAPSFIFTFQTQQVNCLRNEAGDVVEGGVDDIRTVFYAMAVTRHPFLDDDPEEAVFLEYPWQIQELAIVGNQQCW